MWKRATTIAVTGTATGVAVLEIAGTFPESHSRGIGQFALSIAIIGSARLMLWCHNRPIADAYEMGLVRGRREALREANRRAPSPIRPGGFAEFNREHGKRIKIDA